MAKRYFVISDIHSFYMEMREALFKAGFRKKNKDHILIVIGDTFDRGPDALKTYEYIHSIPKYRRVLIKGNHEDLYKELLDKRWPDNYDISNKTLDTFCQIAGIKEHNIYEEYHIWHNVVKLVANHAITKWLFSDEWVNYYELGPFIFTHSFIPLRLKDKYKEITSIYSELELPEDCFEFNPDWRNADEWDWHTARWGAPHKKFAKGLFQEKDKTLVVGHWHTSAFFELLKNCYKYSNELAPIYYSKQLIGLDSGVYEDKRLKLLVHRQNVLVIDENWNCYDENGNKLKEIKRIPQIETISAKDL